MADDASDERDAGTEEPSAKNPLPGISKTLGGRQFWTDICFLQGWRIQKNIITGHHRLLNPSDVRYAAGSLAKCQDQLEAQRKECNLKPASGRIVVLIHGLVRSSKSFHGMSQRLRNDGYTVVGFDYASTRVSIPDSADALHDVVESLGSDVESIDFVVHSMGGLILRSYLHRFPNEQHRRAILLGVPNHGSEIAETMKSNRLFRVIYGPAGQQLGTGEKGIASELPVPNIDFGIVAGGKRTEKGFNPLLGSDNDSTVTVESTRLAGAQDFLLVPVMHSFLMSNSEIIDATSHFLQHGRFRENGPAEPIPASNNAAATSDVSE